MTTNMADQSQHAPANADPQHAQIDQTQLLEYVNQLEAQLQALTARINANTQQCTEPTPPTTAPPAPAPPAPKLVKPQSFGGKVNEVVDTWIFNIEQYNLVVQMNEEHLVLFATSYLL